MIYFNFTIQNPWHNDKKSPWRDLYQDVWTITKNKTLGVRFDFYTWDWFEVSINTRWRGQSHAGPSINLRLFGLGFTIELTDNRHWNDDENRWADYDNPEEMKKWG